MSINTNWLKKYKPQNIGDIIGFSKIKAQFEFWLNNFKKDINLKSAILLSGSSGIGKSIFVDLFLKKYGYFIHKFTSNQHSRDVIESIIKIHNSSNIHVMFSQSKPFAIFIDEVDCIMNLGSKNNINFLIDILNPLKGKKKLSADDKTKILKLRNIPIICVCNNRYEKKIIDIKKNSYNIIIDQIDQKEQIEFIHKICEQENLNFYSDDKIEEYLVNIVNNDIRQLILALQELKYIYNDKIIRKSDIKLSYLKNNKKDFSLFESSFKIFNKKLSLRESQTIYEIDSFFIPLMLFENYNLFEQYPISSNNFKHILRMNEYFSICDNLDKEIFKNQFWNLKQYQSILLCYHISQIMSSDKNKDIKPIFNSINDIKYTLYPSKISNQLLIKKYLYNFYNKFNLNHNFDSLNLIHKFRFILLLLLENLELNKNFLDFFSLNVSEIEQISKILKSNQTKIVFTYKFKTSIRKCLQI